jgi:type II secretion system protein N
LWRKGLLPLLVGLAGFLVGIHLFFPAAALRMRLLAEVQNRLPPGMTLTLQQLELNFPLRLGLDGVTLQTGLDGMPSVAFEQVELRPTWATLLGDPGLVIDAHGADGRLAGVVSLSGSVVLQLIDGRFELAFPPPSRLQVKGGGLAAVLAGRFPLGPQSTLRATLQLDQLLLRGGEGLGLATADLPLGHLQLEVEGTGRSLQVRTLTLAGGAVQVEGKGELLAQASLAASRIDLALQLRLADGGDPALRGLFDLLGTPQADGLYRFRLHGPLAKPALN